jgi:MFS family permease
MTTNNNILRNPTLITIGIAESISAIGDWITMMAVLAMLIFRGGGGVAQSSAIFLAGLLPTILASPIAGWLCDRVDRKWLMIFSQVVSGLIISGLIFVERLELIYILLALQAVSVSIMPPARQAVIPDLVDRENLTRANAFLQQLSSIIKIGAPMLAGLILSIMNPHNAIILDVISFALAALILLRLPSLPPHKQETPAARQSHSPFKQMLNTLGSVFKEMPQLRLLFISIFLGILVIVGFDVLATVYSRDVLLENERFFGLMVGLIGIGSIAASLLLMLRKKNINPWRDLMAGFILLAFIPFSLVFTIYNHDPALGRSIIIFACLVGGIGNGLVHIQISTLLQLHSPAAALGQIGGAFQSFAAAGQLVGTVLVPLLVPVLVSMGVYSLISGLALLTLVGYIGLNLPAAPLSAAAPLVE